MRFSVMASISGNGKSTITIRIVRSFVHTNWKPLVLKDIDLSCTTTEQLMALIYSILPNSTLPPPFRTFKGCDTLKIETHRFGHKTNDPLINREDDDKLILVPGLTLAEQGVEHETEISFFNRADYMAYKETKLS